ncbi:8205_t:CDS:1, partial [Rhizophagus irregularis]
LLTYEQNQSYNQYYSVTHHKHEEVSHEKLNKLIKSFELSFAQP